MSRWKSCKDCGIVVRHGFWKRHLICDDLCNKHIKERIKSGKGVQAD